MRIVSFRVPKHILYNVVGGWWLCHGLCFLRNDWWHKKLTKIIWVWRNFAVHQAHDHLPNCATDCR